MANNWNVPDAVHRNTPEPYKPNMISNPLPKLYIIIEVIFLIFSFLKPGLIKLVAQFIIAIPSDKLNLC